jgi:glucose-1-phosphate thymidylyltransferase
LERGAVWLDTGTFDSLSSASEFVRVVQERQNLKISSPEEVAWRLGLITQNELFQLASTMPQSDYSAYLADLARP